MKANITINMDNAAFDDDPMHELGRILNCLVLNIKNGVFTLGDNTTLRNINGNCVGSMETTV